MTDENIASRASFMSLGTMRTIYVCLYQFSYMVLYYADFQTEGSGQQIQYGGPRTRMMATTETAIAIIAEG